MGHIPNFTNTIFPTASIPLFTLTANIGLVLFLFLIGLEVDLRLAKRNARASTAISVAGLCIPLGMGAGLGAILYPKFIHPSVHIGYFILFTAVAIGITAFPVLCRILTELKLLDTSVGLTVLAAGVGNDVVGWILLALTVALVNAATGLTALWVLLAGAAFSLFMLFPVRWALKWLAHRTGSLSSGQPTTLMMVVTFLVVLSSAFFTDIIGIHAVFGKLIILMMKEVGNSCSRSTGAFLAGIIIPHENGFAIALVEKFEDLVSLLFVPLVRVHISQRLFRFLKRLSSTSPCQVCKPI
jgi:Kef-type K+ transport system membrane component KefB